MPTPKVGVLLRVPLLGLKIVALLLSLLHGTTQASLASFLLIRTPVMLD